MTKHTAKRTLALVIVILLIAGAFSLLSVRASVRSLIKHLDHADFVWLMLIIGAQSFAYAAYVIPYKLVYQLNLRDALRHSFEGFMPLRPAGGLAYDLGVHKGQAKKAFASYLGLWEYAVLAPAILIAAIYAYLNNNISGDLSLPWIIGVPSGTLIFLIGLKYRDLLRKYRPTNRVISTVIGMLKHTSLKDTVFLLFGMILYWSGEIFALYGALKLFNIHLGWFALLIAYATAFLFSRRSLPLGGAGIVLVMLALSLHWVGVAFSVALLAALAYQIINLLVPLLYCSLRSATSQANA